MTESPIDVLENLRAEAERIEEDCTYNSQGHFIATRRWEVIEYLLDLPAVLLSAFAAFFAFTNYAVTAGVLSIIILLLTTASLFLKPAERSLRHKGAGEKFAALRQACRIYADVELATTGRSRQSLADRLIALADRKNELNTDSPRLPDFAYLEAKKHITEGRTVHDVDQRKLTRG